MSLQLEIGYERMEAVNDVLMRKVGCFAFLLPSKSMYWEYELSDNPKQRFERICLALYVYYFDYGRKFLDYILKEINRGDPSLNYLLHKEKVQTIRTRIAHGIFDNATENEMYLDAPRNATNEIDWEQWINQIVLESNSMLTNIELWAQNAGNHRRAFSDDVFNIRCINDHIVFFSIDKDVRGVGQDSAKTKLISRGIDTKRWLRGLNSDIKNNYTRNSNYGPSDIVYAINRELFRVHNGTQNSSLSRGASLLNNI